MQQPSTGPESLSRQTGLHTAQLKSLQIPARDGYLLGASWYPAQLEDASPNWVVINSATAVPQQFYKHLAWFLAEQGLHVLCYDYRGIGQSRPASLRGFQASVSDWALQDMAGVLDWVHAEHSPHRLGVVGHSIGGQMMGLLDRPERVDAMVTLSSQSGYWKLQGGEQKWAVLAHMYLTFPLLTQAFGYMPWSKLGSTEDLPKAAAQQWSSWCRHPDYLFGDQSLPLERYQGFSAPVLAYSFADDKWGTERAVDAMMQAYPKVRRRHIHPQQFGLARIGHFGYFRPQARSLWGELASWLLPEAGKNRLGERAA